MEITATQNPVIPNRPDVELEMDALSADVLMTIIGEISGGTKLVRDMYSALLVVTNTTDSRARKLEKELVSNKRKHTSPPTVLYIDADDYVNGNVSI